MADRIPEGWRECKLGDVVNIIPGFAFKSEHFGNEGIPVIKITDINPPYINVNDAMKVDLTYYDSEKLEKYKISKDDFVIAMTGATIGKIGRLNENITAIVNQRVAKIVPKKNTDKKFVYYSIHGEDFQTFVQNNIDSNSAQENISGTSISRYCILLPPFHEQRAIASVLGSLDDKIDLLNRENQTLEQTAETIFRQWFIEEANEEWEEGTIANMLDILPGFPFKSELFTELGKYCLITIKSVQDGRLDISKTDKINDIPSRMPNYCYLKLGDILLSLTGNVGRCCLVDVNNALLNQRVAKLFAKNSRDMAYTYIYFRMEKTKRLLEEMAKGTAQPNLSPVETLRIKMRIPPKSKLELFSSKSNPIIKRILCNKMQIRTLEKLRDTLLPKLMSGEVRVKL
ncbi:MAG: EcoKI restriction-modification system protein HsdS [Deltaproteobacteria bacterium ADurb.Bin135]|jgi:type I restriction enzyme S subunit|nr:MAG: EcoKI restriction-modification system protein HsdS [Deltaproteobacteria bacterium ADurb.Bin135]